MEIRNIQIEIVQGCNRLCDFCGLNKIADKRIKYMPQNVFDTFVKQVITDCKDNIRIDFAVHGEPLLHPDIVSYIKQLRDAKPKSQISIISNGIIATKELISNLFKAGINYLMFDMYDNQRQNLSLETILKNQTIPVLNFYEDNINIWSYKGHTQQNIIYTPPINTHSGNRRTRVLHTAGGNMPEEVYNKYKINRSEIPLYQRCSKPFYECSINYNGNVCLCCEDWQHSFIIGNIMTDSIHTIFNSDKMQEARYLLYNKRRDLIPLCSRCTQKSFRTGFLKIEKTFPKYNINNNKQHGFFKPKEEFLQYYFYFISERQNIFWNRLEKGLFQYSYTKDPILHKYKFTNVYRLLDRTTQYMLSEVIMVGKKHKYSRRDMFWRIMIFKHFNKPATWQYLIKKFGDVTAETPLLDIISAIDEFSKINKPYSDVYILTSRIFVTNLELRKTLGFTKNDNPHWWGYYLSSYEIFIKKQELDVHILKSDTIESIFKSLKEITGIGDFLAYQYTQDLLYANLFKFDCAKAHNDFCITGLGTKRGIERCFHINTKTINTEYIKILQYIQINFKELMGEYAQQFKPLSSNWYPKMPDLCNCFCEIDKYLRIKEHKQQIKLSRYYRQPNTIKYVFPEGWDIPEIN